MTNYPTIGKSFENIGNQVQSSVPHIMIGTEGISTKGNSAPAQLPQRVQQPVPPGTPMQPRVPIQPRQYPMDSTDKLYGDIRKWAFVIAVLAVIGYAAYRLLF